MNITLLLRRWSGLSFDNEHEPPPKALVAAFGGLGLVLVGLVGWLMLNGKDTMQAWEAGIPQVTVPIKDPSKDSGKGAESQAMVSDVTLTPAPAQGLVEESKAGTLPRIAVDGRKPWQVYARPFPAADTHPRIALVIADMGLSGVITGAALNKLPPPVTLAFLPYTERLDSWVEQARNKGHEVILSVPMEPQGFPRNDPGPNALLTTLLANENQERLRWSLGRVTGYTGITTTTGSKFLTDAKALKPVMEELNARGLLFLDTHLTPKSEGVSTAETAGVPRALVDLTIDRDLARSSIDEQLRQLEAIAKERGSAVGLGFPYPSTVERINLWITSLQDRGFVLAPLSSVVAQQKGPLK